MFFLSFFLLAFCLCSNVVQYNLPLLSKANAPSNSNNFQSKSKSKSKNNKAKEEEERKKKKKKVVSKPSKKGKQAAPVKIFS